MAANESVTIIIPTLNSAENISNLIRSIYNQTYRPIETIIVDGGSSDGTLEICNEFTRKFNSDLFRIRVLSEKDFGATRSVPNARNLGILHAMSKYILFFDDDFELTDASLVMHAKSALEEHEHVGVKVNPRMDTWLELHCAIDDFRKDLGCNVHTHCGYRREVFEMEQFDPRLAFGEDRDLQYRLGLKPLNVDSFCSRHFIHTFEEWKRESYWYGGAFPYLLQKYWRKLDLSINPFVELASRTVNLFLFGFSVIGAVLSVPLLMVAFALFWARILHLYFVSPSRKSWRLVYIILKVTYSAFWFVVGILARMRTKRTGEIDRHIDLNCS